MKYLFLLLTLFSSPLFAGKAAVATGSYGRATPQFYIDVAKGAVEGYSTVNVLGHAALDVTYQTLWSCSAAAYSWPSSPLVMSIASADANDNSTGTGARTVVVEGLDSLWMTQTVSVSLAGVTPVVIPGTWMRINSIRVDSAGSTGGAIGVISVTNGGVTYSCIVNGYNASVDGKYTVPAGYYGLVLQGAASAEAGKSVEIDVYARPFSKVFSVSHHVHLYQNFYQYIFKSIQVLPPKSDMDVRGKSSAAGAEASASFDILLIREDKVNVQ